MSVLLCLLEPPGPRGPGEPRFAPHVRDESPGASGRSGWVMSPDGRPRGPICSSDRPHLSPVLGPQRPPRKARHILPRRPGPPPGWTGPTPTPTPSGPTASRSPRCGAVARLQLLRLPGPRPFQDKDAFPLPQPWATWNRCAHCPAPPQAAPCPVPSPSALVHVPPGLPRHPPETAAPAHCARGCSLSLQGTHPLSDTHVSCSLASC